MPPLKTIINQRPLPSDNGKWLVRCSCKIMSKKIVTVEVRYKYELEIDDENPIVQDYEGENHLLVDCAIHQFGSNLPVIKEGGVVVKDVELVEVS